MSLKLEATIEGVAIVLELSSYQCGKHLAELIVLRFPVAGDVEGSSQVSGDIYLLQHCKLFTFFTESFIIAVKELSHSTLCSAEDLYSVLEYLNLEILLSDHLL